MQFFPTVNYQMCPQIARHGHGGRGEHGGRGAHGGRGVHGGCGVHGGHGVNYLHRHISCICTILTLIFS